jgi:hypothetical protein
MSDTVQDIGAGEAAQVFAGSTNQVAAHVKAELDQQVTTAKQYPRSITSFMRAVETMACVSERVAADCLYALPRKDSRGAVKSIEGPSVRLAEIISSSWGNCRVAGRVLDDSGEWVVAQGVFHDLERNVATSVETRRRIVDRNGRRYSLDMILTTANAAVSIAIRNAILRGVPRSYWDGAYEKARKVVAGDASTLATRRLEALDYLAKMGVSADRVYHALDLKGLEDLTVDHLVTLRATVTAVRDGDVTLDEAFPDPKHQAEEQAKAKAGVAGVKESLAAEAQQAGGGPGPAQSPAPRARRSK